MKDEAFVVKVWGKDQQINLLHLGNLPLELSPTELHVKVDGDIFGGPSFCYVLEDAQGRRFFAQISETMLIRGLEEAKYVRES